jgi:hypothetical protein
MNSEESSTTLNSRIIATNQFIHLNQVLNIVDRAKISPFTEWRRCGGGSWGKHSMLMLQRQGAQWRRLVDGVAATSSAGVVRRELVDDGMAATSSSALWRREGARRQRGRGDGFGSDGFVGGRDLQREPVRSGSRSSAVGAVDCTNADRWVRHSRLHCAGDCRGSESVRQRLAAALVRSNG